MKLLVIIADDILINTSANLCHLAYLRGLVYNGHQVDLLSAENKDIHDKSMILPKDIHAIFYDGVSIYEKVSPAGKTPMGRSISLSEESTINNRTTQHTHKEIVSAVISNIKKCIRSLYGVYGFKIAFVKRALRYRNEVKYDYVLSFSYPQASHLLAYKLIKKQHIKTDHWIQIWEDPWASDLYYDNNLSRIAKEESKLLSYAEKVCYVTPLTLLNQKKKYSHYSRKMYWLPLPAYYKREESDCSAEDSIVFGYFGDYYPYSRNLKPFYDAVVKTGLETYFCGNPSDLFSETKNVKILPRISVSELKNYEERVNVLVFVCNLGGGQVPGKIYQYSATNKKILFILDGSEEEQTVLYNYFSSFNRYYFCKNTVKDISDAIERIIANNDDNIKNIPVDYFEPKNIAKELLENSK